MQSRRYKQLGAYNRRVFLLYGGVGVTAVWALLVNICNLEFLIIGLVIPTMKMKVTTA
jgi:hypothetical protein